MIRPSPAPNPSTRTVLLLASSLLACGTLYGAAGDPAAVATRAVYTAPAPGTLATPASGGRADEVRGLLRLGSSLTDRGDFDGAEIAYRQVLSRDNAALADTKTALLGLAHMHRKQGALSKAVAIYEKYLKMYPADDRAPDALLELGRTLRTLGAYNTAITRFYSVINSTLKLPPEGFAHYQQLAKTAQFEIAETQFQAGDFAEAGKFFARLKLLDLAPADQARASFMAAYSLDLQGDKEGSIMMLRSYLEQWPGDDNVPEARYLLATNLRAANRMPEALQATLELLRAEKSLVSGNPKRWAYWQRRAGNQLANDFFENGDILDAQAIYTGLASLSSDLDWQLPVTYQIALCDERLGAADRARISYKKIVDSLGPTPSEGMAELSSLATWRLSQLDWHDSIVRQVTALVDNRTGQMSPPVRAPRTITQ